MIFIKSAWLDLYAGLIGRVIYSRIGFGGAELPGSDLASGRAGEDELVRLGEVGAIELLNIMLSSNAAALGAL